MLKECKKPTSTVNGDIFPELVSPNSDMLAISLASFFNRIIKAGEWPENWKVEIVVVIPKCTPLFSKTFERFVFARLGNTEIKLATLKSIWG